MASCSGLCSSDESPESDAAAIGTPALRRSAPSSENTQRPGIDRQRGTETVKKSSREMVNRGQLNPATLGDGVPGQLSANAKQRQTARKLLRDIRSHLA